MEALVDCVVELAGGPRRAFWVIESDGGDGAILIGELLSRDELVATLTPTEVAARGRRSPPPNKLRPRSARRCAASPARRYTRPCVTRSAMPSSWSTS